jgi:hypothetical protein
VTVEAEAHREAMHLVQQRHLVDLAMTLGTVHALRDVDGVIEIHVVRQLVDSMPDERPIGCETVTHRREDRCVGPDLRMAGHAGISRRHACIAGCFDCGVTEATVDPQATDVMAVAEWNGLLDGPASMQTVVHTRQYPPPANAKRHR